MHLASPQVIEADRFISIDHTSLIFLKCKGVRASVNLTFVFTDLYKLRLTYVPCLLALLSKYPLLPHSCTLPMKASGRSTGTDVMKSSSLVDHRENTVVASEHVCTPLIVELSLKAEWYPAALKKVKLALNTLFFFCPCSGWQFLQELPGKSVFELMGIYSLSEAEHLISCPKKTYQCSLFGPASANQWWESCVCTMTEIETHYSTYLYVVVIQRTGFGFQKRKSIYRREA